MDNDEDVVMLPKDVASKDPWFLRKISVYVGDTKWEAAVVGVDVGVDTGSRYYVLLYSDGELEHLGVEDLERRVVAGAPTKATNEVERFADYSSKPEVEVNGKAGSDDAVVVSAVAGNGAVSQRGWAVAELAKAGLNVEESMSVKNKMGKAGRKNEKLEELKADPEQPTKPMDDDYGMAIVEELNTVAGSEEHGVEHPVEHEVKHPVEHGGKHPVEKSGGHTGWNSGGDITHPKPLYIAETHNTVAGYEEPEAEHPAEHEANHPVEHGVKYSVENTGGYTGGYSGGNSGGNSGGSIAHPKPLHTVEEHNIVAGNEEHKVEHPVKHEARRPVEHGVKHHVENTGGYVGGNSGGNIVHPKPLHIVEVHNIAVGNEEHEAEHPVEHEVKLSGEHVVNHQVENTGGYTGGCAGGNSGWNIVHPKPSHTDEEHSTVAGNDGHDVEHPVEHEVKHPVEHGVKHPAVNTAGCTGWNPGGNIVQLLVLAGILLHSATTLPADAPLTGDRDVGGFLYDRAATVAEDALRVPTQDPEKAPRALSASGEVPLGAKKVHIGCSNECFKSAPPVRQILQASENECYILPIVAEDALRVPTQDSWDDGAQHNWESGDEDPSRKLPIDGDEDAPKSEYGDKEFHARDAGYDYSIHGTLSNYAPAISLALASHERPPGVEVTMPNVQRQNATHLAERVPNHVVEWIPSNIKASVSEGACGTFTKGDYLGEAAFCSDRHEKHLTEAVAEIDTTYLAFEIGELQDLMKMRMKAKCKAVILEDPWYCEAISTTYTPEELLLPLPDGGLEQVPRVLSVSDEVPPGVKKALTVYSNERFKNVPLIRQIWQASENTSHAMARRSQHSKAKYEAVIFAHPVGCEATSTAYTPSDEVGAKCEDIILADRAIARRPSAPPHASSASWTRCRPVSRRGSSRAATNASKKRRRSGRPCRHPTACRAAPRRSPTSSTRPSLTRTGRAPKPLLAILARHYQQYSLETGPRY